MDLLILIIVLALLAETTVLFVKSLKKDSKKSGRRKIFIDTSSLIDGRILDLAKSGFMSDDLYIPRSVIRELQLLADGKDQTKRMIARRGMDNANELERAIHCNATIFEDELDRTPVDERLIALAKEYRGLICTNDYNLNKVATTEHIEVLNINELTMALAGPITEGSHIHLKITERGSSRGQGVGHMEDGTMVVVDGASRDIGKTVSADVVRTHQTSAGRMIFAKKSIKKK